MTGTNSGSIGFSAVVFFVAIGSWVRSAKALLMRVFDNVRFCIGAVLASLVCAFAAGCGGSNGFSGCQLPAVLPHLAGTPIPPQPIPAGANVSGPVTVIVNATVDSGGNLTGASIGTSSGNATIDAAAIAIVRQSRFTAGLPGCGGGPPPTTATVSVTYQ